MSVVIRMGNRGDLKTVKRCVDEAYVGYIARIGRRPASMDTDFEPLLESGSVWVLEVDGDVVGTMTLLEGTEDLEVRSVAVFPAHQKRGFGRKLISHAEHITRQRGRRVLRLYTNTQIPELVTYYSGLGFVEEKREFDQGYHRVFMVKHL